MYNSAGELIAIYYTYLVICVKYEGDNSAVTKMKQIISNTLRRMNCYKINVETSTDKWNSHDLEIIHRDKYYYPDSKHIKFYIKFFKSSNRGSLWVAQDLCDELEEKFDDLDNYVYIFDHNCNGDYACEYLILDKEAPLIYKIAAKNNLTVRQFENILRRAEHIPKYFYNDVHLDGYFDE